VRCGSELWEWVAPAPHTPPRHEKDKAMPSNNRPCQVCGNTDARDPDAHLAKYGHMPVYE
jgi:hypothetical protein